MQSSASSGKELSNKIEIFKPQRKWTILFIVGDSLAAAILLPVLFGRNILTVVSIFLATLIIIYRHTRIRLIVSEDSLRMIFALRKTIAIPIASIVDVHLIEGRLYTYRVAHLCIETSEASCISFPWIFWLVYTTPKGSRVLSSSDLSTSQKRWLSEFRESLTR